VGSGAAIFAADWKTSKQNEERSGMAAPKTPPRDASGVDDEAGYWWEGEWVPEPRWERRWERWEEPRLRGRERWERERWDADRAAARAAERVFRVAP
jgi:hypothetical protein